MSQPVSNFCTNCGAHNRPDGAFCRNCGAALPSAVYQQPPSGYQPIEPSARVGHD